MTEEQYLKERLNDQIKWYSAKGRMNQHLHKRYKLLEIIAASMIPFLSGMSSFIPFSEWIIGGLDMTIAIAAAISSIYKFHENWIEYRNTSETLKQEKMLYLTHTTPYHTENRFNILVARAESIMNIENQNWLAFTRVIEAKKKDVV